MIVSVNKPELFTNTDPPSAHLIQLERKEKQAFAEYALAWNLEILLIPGTKLRVKFSCEQYRNP